MIKMSFYDGTLDRAKAREVVETSEKPLMFRYGLRREKTYNKRKSIEYY